MARAEVLGRGGQGLVVQVSHISGVKPDLPLVLKTYDRPDELDGRALAHAVLWRRSLGDDDRRRVDECCAWPLAVVTRSDWPVGILMRQVPVCFVEHHRLPSGRESALLREAQFLMAPTAMLAARGMAAPDLDDRRAVLEAFASALSLLHRLGVVLADISTKNLLWRMRPAAVFLLDCDGMRLVGSESPLPPVNSPGWRDPAFAGGLSQASDVYKFGLFVVRVLEQEFQTNTAQAAVALGPEVGRLAEDSLSSDPSRRPTAEQWRAGLAPPPRPPRRPPC